MKLHWSIWKTIMGVGVGCLLYLWVVENPRTAWKHQDRDLRQADKQETLVDIHWYRQWSRYGVLIVPGFIMGIVGLVALSKVRATQKRAAVHTYEVGQSKFAVHEKDLHVAAPLAMGLMTAEQLRQMNAGSEQAFEMYTKMADAQTRQIHALLKGSRAAQTRESALPDAPEPIALATPHAAIPTFHDLLRTGEIAPDKPMILGYENGVPRRGSFLDIYSAAIAGESGSGKTATMLFLIGSALVSMPVRFFGIDPHYPHPKSLGAKTKPLWEAGLMTMATFKDDMQKVLHEVQRTIDRRLKTLETDTVPVVLVIDELAFLSKTAIGPAIAQTMERISMEGRKCQVYMLASSQTWLAARTGDSSVVRDTLTSAYVHRIKPKQANLLLQDRDEAEKVKKYVKQAGEALLCPVGNDSVIVRIPYTTEADLRRVAEQIGERRRPAATRHHLHPAPAQALAIQADADLDAEFEKLAAGVSPTALAETRAETGATPEATTPPSPFGEFVRTRLAAIGLSQNKLAEQAGISKKDMSLFLNGGKLVAEAVKLHILQILERAEEQRNTLKNQAETAEVTDSETTEEETLATTVNPETIPMQ